MKRNERVPDRRKNEPIGIVGTFVHCGVTIWVHSMRGFGGSGSHRKYEVEGVENWFRTVREARAAAKQLAAAR